MVYQDVWQHGMILISTNAFHSIVQPIDLVKTRMQLQGQGGAPVIYKNSLQAFTGIAKTEGLSGMYKGYCYAISFY